MDLTMLAEDLDPLVVHGLVEQLEVAVSGDARDGDTVSLLAAARRRTRLLVEGLPDAGKGARGDAADGR